MAARVLVLNCFVKGWNILKSLADAGFIVNGADFRPNAPGLFSNRIKDRSQNLLYPNPKLNEKAFVECVLEHVASGNVDIVLPVNAAEMMALARYKTEIEKHALFPFENYHKLLLLHDKKYFFEIMAGNLDLQVLPATWSVGDRTAPISDILEQSGLGIGATCRVPFSPMVNFPSADHFINANPGVIYPLVVKTRRSTSSVGVYHVKDKNQLREACAKLGNEDIIVQETLNGRGVGISSIRWPSPEVLHHFGHKRVREYPISGGASTSREPWDCDDHPLTTSLSKLLNTLDWHGVVMFELKELKAGNDASGYKFLEANPRFWGSVPLAIVNGVDFPVLLCRAALGKDPGNIINVKKKRARILFSDSLSLVLNVLHGRRIGYNLADYFNPMNLFLDDMDWGDLPATRRIFGRMLAEFFSRVFSSK